MELTTALLCDFAQVRDGLMFVASGGVTRIHRHAVPAPLGLMVAVVVEVPLADAAREHTVSAQVLTREGAELAALVTTFRVGTDGLYRNEAQQVPLVMSLLGVQAQAWGTHVVRLALDGEVCRRLTFYVVPAHAEATVRDHVARPPLAATPPDPAAPGSPEG